MISIGRILTLSGLIAGLFTISGCSSNASIPAQFEQGIQNAISLSRSSIVTIEVMMNDTISSPDEVTGRGAGVVLDDEGTIATTFAFINGGKKFIVLFQDGCSAEANLVGSDRELNLAILTTAVHYCGCFPIKVAIDQKISTGSLGIIVNNTSVSKGVSAGLGLLAESWLGGDDFWGKSLLIAQTGDILAMEGAPVVTFEGRLIGICDAIIEDHHGAWTIIPSETILKVARELKQSGLINRGWIGASCSFEESEQTGDSGVKSHIRVNQVVDGSPAQAGGVEVGDYLVSLNEHPIAELNRLRESITGMTAGTKIKLDLIKSNRKVHPAELTTAALPQDSRRQRLCSSRTL